MQVDDFSVLTNIICDLYVHYFYRYFYTHVIVLLWESFMNGTNIF